MSTLDTQQVLLDRLSAELDPSEWSVDADLIATACEDWRKRYQTTAACVVTPKSVDSLCKAVAICHELDVAITTQGGNTGLVGGGVPAVRPTGTDRIELVLRTTRLRQSLTVDKTNLTITADAGYTLKEVQEAAAAHGLYFPLSLASEGSCTIGGNLASNAGGVAVLRYGNSRELCLGLEFVNAKGQLCGDIRGLRKNNTGYDLRHLLIGSEGTLGIITRACMKVFPAPTAKVVAWFNVQSLSHAVATLTALQGKFYGELSSYEWMNQEAIDLVQSHADVSAPGFDDFPGCDHVLAEFTSLGTQEELTETIEEGLGDLLENSAESLGILNVFIAQSLSDNEAYWAVRENISEAQSKEGLNVKHDIACAVSSLPKMDELARQRIAKSGISVRPVLFGHLGDGNLHYNMSGPKGCDSKDFLREHQETLNKIVHDAVIECGGTISAEHGIGQLKVQLLKEVRSPADYEVMKALKSAMDPTNILNPGKMLIL